MNPIEISPLHMEVTTLLSQSTIARLLISVPHESAFTKLIMGLWACKLKPKVYGIGALMEDDVHPVNLIAVVVDQEATDPFGHQAYTNPGYSFEMTFTDKGEPFMVHLGVENYSCDDPHDEVLEATTENHRHYVTERQAQSGAKIYVIHGKEKKE